MATDLADLGETDVVLRGGSGVEFRPPVVTRLSGVLPWQTESVTTPCGETEVSQNGDINARVTVEGVIFKRHLSQLARLRTNAQDVVVVSPMTQELGIPSVTFDQLQVERQSETDTGTYTFNGQQITEPLYTFQLQSKESGSGGGFE